MKKVIIEKDPITLLMGEHKDVLKKLDNLGKLLDMVKQSDGSTKEKIKETIDLIENDFNVHSLGNEEKALFPVLETFIPRDEGPIAVMLSEHKDIVESIRKFKENLEKNLTEAYMSIGKYIISLLTEHIYKEDNMLYPIAKMHLTNEQFEEIAKKIGLLQNVGSNDLKEKVEYALEKIRPDLHADGGDVELVEINGKVVKLRLLGACGGCPMSTYTLKEGIEIRLKESIPEIESVEAV